MKTTPFRHDDDDLREDVFFELQSEPKITSSDVAIAVKDGVVTAHGLAGLSGMCLRGLEVFGWKVPHAVIPAQAGIQAG